MGNGHGTYSATRKQKYQSFDRLPPWMRQVLARAVASWAPHPILQWWKRELRHLPQDAAMSRLLTMIRREEAEDTWRDYGPDHPEADAHGKRLRPSRHAAWSQKRMRR
jgi:hypothetical protein